MSLIIFDLPRLNSSCAINTVWYEIFLSWMANSDASYSQWRLWSNCVVPRLIWSFPGHIWIKPHFYIERLITLGFFLSLQTFCNSTHKSAELSKFREIITAYIISFTKEQLNLFTCFRLRLSIQFCCRTSHNSWVHYQMWCILCHPTQQIRYTLSNVGFRMTESGEELGYDSLPRGCRGHSQSSL